MGTESTAPDFPTGTRSRFRGAGPCWPDEGAVALRSAVGVGSVFSAAIPRLPPAAERDGA